jgi:hypothetical protein
MDYYSLLGIPPTATTAEIARAYRNAALKYHPDRGGSHQRMVLVNEAWFVLSNPETRRDYDHLRTQRMDAAARAAWNTRTEGVRRRAQEYPRQWSAFERWMNGLMTDIRAAKYGKQQVWITTFPTAGKSFSGWAFIGVGALVGGVLGVAILGSVMPVQSLKFALVIAAAGGAWVGAKVHGFLRDIIGGPHETGTASSPPPTSQRGGDRIGASRDEKATRTATEQVLVAEIVEHETLRCPKCGQSLRVPSLDKEILVTCPSCKNKFVHKPSSLRVRS